MDIKINLKQFEEIENAIAYNSSSTLSWAENRILEILKVIIEGGTLIIEEGNIEIRNIGEYKAWKQNGHEYLNTFNTDNLINKLRGHIFIVEKAYLDSIENSLHYNSAAAVKAAESSLIKIVRRLIISEPVLIQSEEVTLRSISDYNNWIKGKIFERYNFSFVIELINKDVQPHI